MRGVVIAFCLANCLVALQQAVDAAEPAASTVIALEYDGPINKPIDTIVISDSKSALATARADAMQRGQDEFFVKGVIVPGVILRRLILKAESRTTNESRRRWPAVVVSVSQDKERKTLILGIAAAMSLVDDFKEIAQGTPSAVSAFAGFKAGISAWLDAVPVPDAGSANP
jgi:hypothetical protein